ncbi:MAG: winged helix DNA-binding domain-containing protein [Dehalococcoidia bacterium]
MDLSDLRRMRLSAHLLAQPAADVATTARWMGALQAQDYQGGLWAIGVRSQGATRSDVESAIERREIVRTWPMRGTLHFIAPELVRPVLRLTAPRIKQRIAARERQLGIDDGVLARATKVVSAQIRERGPSTRPELYAAMAGAGLSPDGQRGIHVLGQLARDLLLCFRTGPRETAHVRFARRVAASVHRHTGRPGRPELARRYFQSHGPATVRDFAWWSNLTLADARGALDACKAGFTVREVGGVEYWFDPEAVVHHTEVVQLLPVFDELILGYTDRSTVAPPDHLRRLIPGSNGMFLASVVDADGEIRGLWRRQASKRAGLTFDLFDEGLDEALLASAAARYADFLESSTPAR